MKSLFFIPLLFIPLVVFPQWNCDFGSGYVCPKPYEIDLDKDTIYSFTMKKDYCEKIFYGTPTYFRANFNTEGYSGLWISHDYSVNCCTVDKYYIRVQKDTIRISTTSEEEVCTCGNCTYYVRYTDYNPSKSKYRIVVENVTDTIVSVASNTNFLQNDDSFIKYTQQKNKIKISINNNDLDTNIFDVALLNIDGKIMFQQKFYLKEFLIDVPKNRGIYILKVWNGRKTGTLKIVI